MAYFLARPVATLGRALACAFGIVSYGLSGPSFAADIDVVLDQATLAKLPERVATLVIGNPLIADAAVQAGGLMVITGRGYGRTNLIALDRAGVVLTEKTVEVHSPRAGIVVVYRGMARESYSCTPYCGPRPTLGDSTPFFDAAMGQASARTGQALAGAK
jgi:Flp pilus assembly secretin CpaC